MVLDEGDVGTAEGLRASEPATPKVIYENGKVWLLFPSGAPESTIVRIYDVRGALVRELRPEPGTRELGLELPGRGVYFVLVKTGTRGFYLKVLQSPTGAGV